MRQIIVTSFMRCDQSTPGESLSSNHTIDTQNNVRAATHTKQVNQECDRLEMEGYTIHNISNAIHKLDSTFVILFAFITYKSFSLPDEEV